jgi:hypothetical protein
LQRLSPTCSSRDGGLKPRTSSKEGGGEPGEEPHSRPHRACVRRAGERPGRPAGAHHRDRQGTRQNWTAELRLQHPAGDARTDGRRLTGEISPQRTKTSARRSRHAPDQPSTLNVKKLSLQLQHGSASMSCWFPFKVNRTMVAPSNWLIRELQIGLVVV